MPVKDLVDWNWYVAPPQHPAPHISISWNYRVVSNPVLRLIPVRVPGGIQSSSCLDQSKLDSLSARHMPPANEIIFNEPSGSSTDIQSSSLAERAHRAAGTLTSHFISTVSWNHLSWTHLNSGPAFGERNRTLPWKNLPKKTSRQHSVKPNCSLCSYLVKYTFNYFLCCL